MRNSIDVFSVIKEALYTFFESYDVEDALVCFPEKNCDSLSEIVLYNYTSSIKVSGVLNGIVLVSCDEEFLSEVIKLILGPRVDLKEEYYIDMVGEMSNTISGYFQKFYGDDFMISAPTFLKKGQLADTISKTTEAIHVVEFDLFDFKSEVLVCLA